MRWISIKAIFMGIVTTLAIDLATSLALLVLWPRGDGDGPADALPVYLEPSHLAVALVLGTVSTAIGGAVCARQAPALPYWNTAAYGVVGIVIGMLLSDPAQPIWFSALAWLLTLPAALVGASRALKRG